MAETRLTNTALGARGVYGRDGRLVMIDPGKSATLELDDQELKDAKASGHFEFGGKDADPPASGDPPEPEEPPVNEGGGGGFIDHNLAEPSALDGSVADLRDHLEGVNDVAEIDRLIAGEKGGKSRASAMAALEARREELSS